MNGIGITPRESLDMHELIVFKTICATKALTFNILVKDEELKNMLIDDGNITKQHIKELQDLVKTSPFLQSETTN